MKNSPLGCLTGSGVIAGALTLLIIAGLVIARGGLMFSPGPLNAQEGPPLGGAASHAEIGEDCGMCHTPFWTPERMADRCVTCHAEIGSQWEDPASLHGALRQVNPGLSCRSCHPDHRGATALLTELDGYRFPHDLVGYSLTGHAHHSDGSAFACADCHPDGITVFDQAACQDCHLQLDAAYARAHILGFGEDCLVCHDGLDTYGDDFDHDRLAFPLTGKHAEATCSSCHLSARSIPDLQAAPTECGTCHAADDAHDGRFGTDCGACHVTAGWSPATFDHDLSDFKLTGKHADVACEECHLNRVYQDTPMNCYACHAGDDAHAGQLGQDCALCHTPAGWLPAIFDHSGFPLTAGHAGLACGRCHASGQFAGLSTACAACHAEPAYHAGLFGINCAQCHNTGNWSAAYSGPHPGGCDGNCINHEGASCRDCHTSTLASATCTRCHDSNNPDGDGGGGDDD